MKRTFLRRLVAIVGGLTVLWLGAMIALDLTYGMFPRVLIGGLKILGCGYLLLAALLIAVLALRRLRNGLIRSIR